VSDGVIVHAMLLVGTPQICGLENRAKRAVGRSFRTSKQPRAVWPNKGKSNHENHEQMQSFQLGSVNRETSAQRVVEYRPTLRGQVFKTHWIERYYEETEAEWKTG